ncbi:MAG: hypothetical protein KatS3mg105_2334 [Gemmatales bacterium]|nr:MAG: hypothetical protein KatS3mg105_2334 [Gemmatales bacterium]
MSAGIGFFGYNAPRGQPGKKCFFFFADSLEVSALTSQPNIIFIITDQQRYDTINALGFPYMDTPNLDRLVREGITFSNCFVTAASCAPARASLFTGYYPHTTGILKNADSWTRSWIERLRAAGYRCVNVGKMHSYPYHTPLGFDERYVVENKDRYLEERYYFDEWDKGLRARGLVKQQRELYRQWPDYRERLGAFEWKLPEDAHPDVFVGQMACWWIETYPVTRPLFLQIGFPGPHPPYDPVPRYAEPYLKKELPLLEVTEDELAGQPPPFLQMRLHNHEVDHDSVVHLLHPTKEQRHRQRAYYLANVTMIDEQVGRILQALEKRGYLEDAVVVFTSDHGDCLGDHGHSQKWTMYDAVTRVPLVVWSPKRFPPAADGRWAVPANGYRPRTVAAGRCRGACRDRSPIAAASVDEWSVERASARLCRTRPRRHLSRHRLHDHGPHERMEVGAFSRRTFRPTFRPEKRP